MAAGSTYTPIATTTLGSAAGNFTFSSIPSTYTDLIIVIAGKETSGGATFLTFNADTGGNYSNTRILGDGSSASSSRRTNNNNIVIDAPNTESSTVIINVMNYANSSVYKTALIRANDNSYISAVVGLWRSTAAITQITMTPDTGNYAAGSMFTLYGIAAA